jgi:hypothetical protein
MREGLDLGPVNAPRSWRERWWRQASFSLTQAIMPHRARLISKLMRVIAPLRERMGLGDGFHWNIVDATLRSGHGATLKPFEPTRVAGFSRMAETRDEFHRSGKISGS